MEAAASKFATTAALHAETVSQAAPASALADSCLSSSASDASSVSEHLSAIHFMPLREEEDKSADVAPVPDRAWWEEFGEWESASAAASQQRPYAWTQPRLVLDDQIVRMPVFKQHEGLLASRALNPLQVSFLVVTWQQPSCCCTASG